MKIIEAMKQIKDLQRKADDLRAKVGVHCADLDYETPMYADQKEQVRQWLQSHGDILKEILRLRVAIQRTNINVKVKIMLGDVAVEKTIAEWIHRRRDLATFEKDAWAKLGDRGLREGVAKLTSGAEREVKIRRYFDPKERDFKVNLYTSEPMNIDAALEVANAITDLQE